MAWQTWEKELLQLKKNISNFSTHFQEHLRNATFPDSSSSKSSTDGYILSDYEDSANGYILSEYQDSADGYILSGYEDSEVQKY